MKFRFRGDSGTNPIAEADKPAAAASTEEGFPQAQPLSGDDARPTIAPDSMQTETEKVDIDAGEVDGGTWSTKNLKLWTEYVSLATLQAANRDHLSNEQTFLAWLSLADGMAILGVVVAQVSRIQQVLRPYEEDSIRYLLLGKPQACLCYGTACLILLIGAYRFFQQQHAMNRGFTVVGGYDVPLLGVFVGLCLLAFFLLLILVDIAGVQ
ncbi:hypothetical protein ABEF92_007490 [Exophiala dermatitidis]|uniref:DUF202 domain-containing protein n=1 Tax=Exophiala dermatitidis (strain ATCC 34100 / CBS 525.76 / NIH/UT8656) TaxID=858893 RepID=H6C6V7_EXODN|nr:uncharacterized protein HMPREF1120_07442 [Exophiala dermatitidis NIH/UT8656]EHY59453.1 hypothetical protein HMPREF1120_07442 [Exophiala dermatitidis NIH/UT8656]